MTAPLAPKATPAGGERAQVSGTTHANDKENPMFLVQVPGGFIARRNPASGQYLVLVPTAVEATAFPEGLARVIAQTTYKAEVIPAAEAVSIEQILEAAANATPAQHIAASYAMKLSLRQHQTREDRNDLFKDAVVATAQYLGRPLTAAEVNEASRLVDDGLYR
jgi:hypothetical protein